MTERLALGITVGASNSVAIAAAGDGSEDVVTHPSVLRLAAGAPPALGGDARSIGRHSSATVLEGFLTRVGDPVDMFAEDGTAHSAATLVATAIGCLIDEIGTGAADSAIACHPAWWSAHTVEAQRAALEQAGLAAVTLIPEPTAAVRWLESVHGPLGDGAVVVYDLGATGLTVSVVRTGEHARLLGTPLRATDVAGAEFDLLTMRYVLANALHGNDFDPFDPAVERELSTLRARCRNAKEELSINTATVVPVRLDPAAPRGEQVRLVRGELEDLLREPLLTSIDVMRDAVHRAGLEIADIGRVLLTGGGGAIPLVTELISSEFGLPVVAAPQPALTSARGAAVLSADLLAAKETHAPIAAVTAIPAPSAPKTKELPSVSKQQSLPTARARRRLTGKQRAAIIAGTAIALAALATGTVAIGTGAQSGPNPPASVQNSTMTPGAAEIAATTGAPTGTPAATTAPVVATTPTTNPNPKPGAAHPAPTSSVVTVNNQTTQADTTAPAEPAAPQPNSPQPNSPQPEAPGTTQQPPPQPRPAPNLPNLPSPPIGGLGDAVDKVGGAASSAAQIPGQILGGNGG
ncbi:Hsp70 family protein [Nocardia sp. NPDC052566]|uniref:Hsp70 family protein n=1 Tax=Nocardia sp. NPDC052566 TaxID=3364330 RepID=UPI0037CADF1D